MNGNSVGGNLEEIKIDTINKINVNLINVMSVEKFQYCIRC